MASLKIPHLGHPVLRQIAAEVSADEIQSAAFQSFIDDMTETMRESDGVGLAAPQVFVSKRVIVLEDWEGCLSIPDLRGKVPRLSLVQ